MADENKEPFRGAPSGRSLETESERAQGGAYPSEVDNRRPSGDDGQPPRAATEPQGSEGSAVPDPGLASDRQTSRETRTDPVTGAPIGSPDAENNQA
ncbi:MAG: TOP6B-like family protein [Proteobacteria bacterium]|nr:TOP6B-like family protein [Pseudomonadota bacterium]